MGKPVVIIGIGVLFAAIAGFMTLGFLKGQSGDTEVAARGTVPVVVAGDTISRGQLVEAELVKTIEWPIDSVPDGAFNSIEQVVGQLARSAIYVDDLLTQAKFLDTKAPSVLSMLIPKGRRAISIKVNEVTGISGFVAPGSRVDLLLTVAADGDLGMPSKTRIVLQDTEVLAIAQSIEQRDSRPIVVNTVTLNVSPREAETLTLASNEGSLHLVLRNDRDDATVASRGTTLEEIIGGKITTGPGVGVELIRGMERLDVRF
jgi:pilus assembly protein CpaB